MRRIMLRIAYDGTNYVGWQMQNNGISIEQVINEELRKITHENIAVIGASRTDSGVHAADNVAVFDTESKIPADKFSYALNAGLPEDIRVQESLEVASDFHPRYSECVKTYEYSIYNADHEYPPVSRYSYFYHGFLDIEAMRRAAVFIVGEHDFASFCSAGAQVKTTVRQIYGIEIFTDEAAGRKHGMITVRICGSGFLYNMVRIIAGTLIQVGAGQYEPEHVREIINSCDRTKAGPTAPAKGLILKKIEYIANNRK